MNIQKATKIALLTTLMTLSGASCWGAAQGDLDMKLIGTILMGEPEEVKQLVAQRANIDSVCNAGNPAITLATRLGHSPIVKVIIEAGADINAINREGETPLITAVLYGKPDIIRVLLQAGANINIIDNKNMTALQLATARLKEYLIAPRPRRLYEQVEVEKYHARFRESIQLLLQYGADIGDLGPELEAMGVEILGG